MAPLYCLTGRPEMEGQLSVITSQYRRLLSTTVVRAQAQCLISGVGLISPEAAKRLDVAGRMESELKEDRRAHSESQTTRDQVGQGRTVAI